MKSIILCEGSTDYILLQYYMRQVHSWEEQGRTNEKSSNIRLKRIRTMIRNDDKLSIASCGGASGILPAFHFVVESNTLSAGAEAYDKIVVLTDRDEFDTEQSFINAIKEILNSMNVQVTKNVCNNEWVECTYKNGQEKERQMEILILIIPFDETGALETFLLDCISKQDTYDADIIKKGNDFVENIDPDKKYLVKRRYVTKAKFDVYFSVRTAAEQFVERQNILRNVEWRNYAELQTSFAKLGNL